MFISLGRSFLWVVHFSGLSFPSAAGGCRRPRCSAELLACLAIISGRVA